VPCRCSGSSGLRIAGMRWREFTAAGAHSPKVRRVQGVSRSAGRGAVSRRGRTCRGPGLLPGSALGRWGRSGMVRGASKLLRPGRTCGPDAVSGTVAGAASPPVRVVRASAAVAFPCGHPDSAGAMPASPLRVSPGIPPGSPARQHPERYRNRPPRGESCGKYFSRLSRAPRITARCGRDMSAPDEKRKRLAGEMIPGEQGGVCRGGAARPVRRPDGRRCGPVPSGRCTTVSGWRRCRRGRGRRGRRRGR
jgi:hypothetical protein